jgi:chromosome segregation ATPase
MASNNNRGVLKRMEARKLTPESETIRKRQRLRELRKELKQIREDLSAHEKNKDILEDLKTRASVRVEAFNKVLRGKDLNAQEREKREKILAEIKDLAAKIGKTGREPLRLRERERKIKKELDESGLIV